MVQNTVSLLWTGGWDSTFRLLQLATQPVSIQPIYVINSDRPSASYEQAAMKRIISIVRERFPAQVLDVRHYDIAWIRQNCMNEPISTAFAYLRKTYNLGTQYEWLSMLLNKLNLDAECAIVRQYHGKVEKAIHTEGRIAPVENDFLPGRMHILPDGEGNAVYTLFRHIILPLLSVSKKEEEQIARDNGWMDIMLLTWFCHTPIHGEPCGICSPCDDAMNTGMEWRLPDKAKQRYRYRTLYIFARKVKGKLLKALHMNR